jgi:hypothetical protein
MGLLTGFMAAGFAAAGALAIFGAGFGGAVFDADARDGFTTAACVILCAGAGVACARTPPAKQRAEPSAIETVAIVFASFIISIA